MQISLQNHTVIITGGAKRLGRAIALECARSGADVAITYRTSKKAAQSCLQEFNEVRPGGQYAAFELEVSRAQSVDRLALDVLERFGGATDLVNSAAIFRRTPFAELNEADFDEHIAANLKGPYLLSKRFGDLFLARGGGAIVNIADIFGIRPLANYIPYCISKAGLIMLTQSMAKALAPAVRVNCICPGTILPPSQYQGENDDEAGLIGKIPMQRLGTPEEIAATVAFLLAGPSFITGAVLPVDGAQILR